MNLESLCVAELRKLLRVNLEPLFMVGTTQHSLPLGVCTPVTPLTANQAQAPCVAQCLSDIGHLVLFVAYCICMMNTCLPLEF